MNIPLRSYSSSGADSALAVGLGLLFMVIYFAVIFAIVGVLYMGIFTKSGRPAWGAFVPVYNGIKLLEIAGRPWYWYLLFFIPFAGIYFSIVSMNDLAKSFGKDAGYTVGLVLLPVVFVPILSYGSARYLGPAAGQQFVAYPQGYAQPYPQGYAQTPMQQAPMQQPPVQQPSGQQYR